MIASARASVDPELYALARTRIATLLGVAHEAPTDEKLRALPQWPDSPLFSERDRACLAFAEQFVLDVSAVSADQRAALVSALGAGAAAFAQTLYAIDFELRARVGVHAAPSASTRRRPTPDAAPGAAVACARGDAARDRTPRSIDPLTSELVRLRGARIHSCLHVQVAAQRARVAAGRR